MRTEHPLRQPRLEALKLERLIDIKYQDLFLIWLALIAGFGFLYFLLSVFEPTHGLTGMQDFGVADKFFSSMYFSVVTATSVGFGDIVPLGISKLLVSVQSIVTIFVSAIFVTKLISYRQEIALYQVHKLTFQNIFYNTREGFFVIRRDFDRVIDAARRGPQHMHEDLWQNLATAFKQGQSLLEEILEFYDTDTGMYIIDIRREQLLLEAVRRTLQRITELLTTLTAQQLDVLGHPHASTELRKLLHVVENVIPVWQTRSPYQETDTFADIRQLGRQIEGQM